MFGGDDWNKTEACTLPFLRPDTNSDFLINTDRFLYLDQITIKAQYPNDLNGGGGGKLIIYLING
jgi:hypothetical protein